MSKVTVINCKNCKQDFNSKRSHSQFCSTKCYRTFPEVKINYYARTNLYQKKHSKEPARRYQKLQHKCKHEKRELDLTLTDCIDMWNKGCFYCKKSLSEETGCALDRLDNSKGYTKDNVVECCGPCNKIKNVYLSHEEMIIAMNAIMHHRQKMIGE